MTDNRDNRKSLFGIGGVVSSTYESMSDSLHGFITRDPYEELKDYAGNHYYPTLKGNLDNNRYGSNNVFYPQGDVTRPIRIYDNDGLFSPLRSDPKYLQYEDWEREKRDGSNDTITGKNILNALGFYIGAEIGIAVAFGVNSITTRIPWMKASMEKHLGEPGEHVSKVTRGPVAGRVIVPMLSGALMGGAYGGFEGALLGAALGNTLGYMSTKMSPFESLIEQGDKLLGHSVESNYYRASVIKGRRLFKPTISSYLTPALFTGVAVASLFNKLVPDSEVEYSQGMLEKLIQDVPEQLMYESPSMYRASPKSLEYKTNYGDLHPLLLLHPNPSDTNQQAWRYNPSYKRLLEKIGSGPLVPVDYVQSTKDKLKSVRFVSSDSKDYSGPVGDITAADRLPVVLTSLAVTGITGGLMSVGANFLEYRHSLKNLNVTIAEYEGLSGSIHRLLKNSETYSDKAAAAATHSKAGKQLLSTMLKMFKGEGSIKDVGKSTAGVASHILADLKSNFKQYASIAGMLGLAVYGGLTAYQNARTVEIATEKQGYRYNPAQSEELEIPIHPETLKQINEGTLSTIAKTRFNTSLMNKIGRTAVFVDEDGSEVRMFDSLGGSKFVSQWITRQKDNSVIGSFYSPDISAKTAKHLNRISNPKEGGIAFSFGHETNNVLQGLFGEHFVDGALGEVVSSFVSSLTASDRRLPEFGNLVNKLTEHLFGTKAYHYKSSDETFEEVKNRSFNPPAGKNLLGVISNAAAYGTLGAVLTTSLFAKSILKGRNKAAIGLGLLTGIAYGIWQPTYMDDKGRQDTTEALSHASGAFMSIPKGYGVLGKSDPFYNTAYGAMFGIIPGAAGAVAAGAFRKQIVASNAHKIVKNISHPLAVLALGITAGAVIGIQRPSSYLQGLGWGWESNLNATFINRRRDLPTDTTDASWVHHAKVLQNLLTKEAIQSTSNMETIAEQAEGKSNQINVIAHIKDSDNRYKERQAAIKWLNSKNPNERAPELKNFILGGYGGNSEARLLNAIYSAKSEITLTGPYMTSEAIFKALKDVSMKGVRVTVNAQNPFSAKGGGDALTSSNRLLDFAAFAKQNNLNITINITREDASLLAHLKVLVIDRTKSFVMSHNLSKASKTTTRELIEIFNGKAPADFLINMMGDIKAKGQLVPLYDPKVNENILSILSKTAYPSISKFRPNKYDTGLLSNLYKPDFSLKYDDGGSESSNRLGNNGRSGIIYLPTSNPDSYYVKARYTRPRLYRDYVDALTNSYEDMSWFQKAVITSADRQLHPESFTEGLGASINEFLNQDLYKEGQGFVGTIVKGLGRFLDTATGYYAMKQLYERQSGNYKRDDVLSAHKGQYESSEDRGFFETFLSSTTKTISSTASALVFYFGFSHAVSLVNAHIEDLGLAHIVTSIIRNVHDGPNKSLSKKAAERAVFSAKFLSGQQSLIAMSSSIAKVMSSITSEPVEKASSKAMTGLFDYIGIKAVLEYQVENNLETLSTGAVNELINSSEGLNPMVDFAFDPKNSKVATAPEGLNLIGQIQDSLDDPNVKQYLVKGSYNEDINYLISEVKKYIKANDLDVSDALSAKQVIESAVKDVIGYNKTTGELDLQRRLIQGHDISEYGAFSWLGRVRAIDQSNFVNIVRPILETISVTANTKQAGELWKAMDNLAMYAGDAPKLRLFENSEAIVPKITNYGTERLRQIAQELDKVAKYIPANPFYYIPGIRNAFNITDLNPTEQNDMSLKGFIGHGFESLIVMQNTIARNITRLNRKGFAKHWSETRWLFGVDKLLSEDRLNSKTSIDKLSNERLSRMVKSHTKLERSYTKRIKLNNISPVSDLKRESAYAGARRTLAAIAGVLIVDKALDMYAMQNSGIDAPTSMLLDWAASRDEEGNKLFQSEYTSTLPISLRLPIAVAGGAVGRRLFYTVGGEYGKAPKDLVEALAKLKALKESSGQFTKEEAARLASFEKLEQLYKRRKTLRTSNLGMFLGAAIALVGAQAVTSLASWTLNNMFRKPYATEGLMADERVFGAVRIGKSISEFVYQKTEQGTKSLNESLTLEDKLNLFLASNAMDRLLHSKTEGYKPQYTFATQIPNPIFQLTLVGKLDPSGKTFAVGAGFQFLPLMGSGSIPPFPISFITKPPDDLKDVLKNEYLNRNLKVGEIKYDFFRSSLYNIGSFLSPQFMSLNSESSFGSALFLAGAASFTRTAIQLMSKQTVSNALIQRELRSSKTFIKAASVLLDSTEKVVRLSQVPTVALPNAMFKAITAFIFPGRSPGPRLTAIGRYSRIAAPYLLSWAVAGAAMAKGGYAESMGTEYEAAGFTGDERYEQALVNSKLYRASTALATMAYFGGAMHYAGVFDAAKNLDSPRVMFTASRRRLYSVYEQSTLLPALRVSRLDAQQELETAAKAGKASSVTGFAKELADMSDDSDQALLAAWKKAKTGASMVDDSLVKSISRLEPSMMRTSGLRIALAGEVFLSTVVVMSLAGLIGGSIGLGREEGGTIQAILQGLSTGPFRLVAGIDPKPNLSGKNADKWEQVSRYRRQILKAKMGRDVGMPNKGDSSYLLGQIGNLLAIPFLAAKDIFGITAPYKDDPKAFLNLFGPIGTSEGSKGWTFYAQSQAMSTDLSTSKYYMDTKNMDISESLAYRVLMQGNASSLGRVVNLLTAQPTKLKASKLRNAVNTSEANAITGTSPELMMALNARQNMSAWLSWQRGEELGISFYRVMAATGRMNMTVGDVPLQTEWKRWNPYDSLRATLAPTFNRFDIVSSISSYQRLKATFMAGNRWLATGSIDTPDLDAVEILSNYRSQQGNSIPILSQLTELFSLALSSVNNDKTKKTNLFSGSTLVGIGVASLGFLLTAATVTGLGFAAITAVSALGAYREGGDRALLTEEFGEKIDQIRSQSYAFTVKDGRISLASTRDNAPGGKKSSIDTDRIVSMLGQRNVKAADVNLVDIAEHLNQSRKYIHSGLSEIGTLNTSTYVIERIGDPNPTPLADTLVDDIKKQVTSLYEGQVIVHGKLTMSYRQFMGLDEQGLASFLDESLDNASPMQMLREDIIKILGSDALADNKVLQIKNVIATHLLDISRRMDIGFGETDTDLLRVYPKADKVIDPNEVMRLKFGLAKQAFDKNATYVGSMVSRYGVAATTGYALKGLVSLAQPILDISQFYYPLLSMGTELGSNDDNRRRQAATAFGATVVEQGMGLLALHLGLKTLMSNPALLIGTTAVGTGLFLADKTFNKGKGGRFALDVLQKLDKPLEGIKKAISSSVYTLSEPTPVRGVLNLFGIPFRTLDPFFTSIHRNTQNTGWGAIAYWVLPQTTESRMFTTAEEYRGKSSIWGERPYEMSMQEVAEYWKQKERRQRMQSASIQANLDYDLVSPELQGSISSPYSRIYFDKYFDNAGYIDRVLANFAPSSSMSNNLRLAAIAKQRLASSSAGAHWLGGAANISAGQSTNLLSLSLLSLSRVGHATGYGRLGLVEEVFRSLAGYRQKGSAFYTYLSLQKEMTFDWLKETRVGKPFVSVSEKIKSNDRLMKLLVTGLSSKLGTSAIIGSAAAIPGGYIFNSKYDYKYDQNKGLAIGFLVGGAAATYRYSDAWMPKLTQHAADLYAKHPNTPKFLGAGFTLLLGALLTLASVGFVADAFNDEDDKQATQARRLITQVGIGAAGSVATLGIARSYFSPSNLRSTDIAIKELTSIKTANHALGKFGRSVGRAFVGLTVGSGLLGQPVGWAAGGLFYSAYPDKTEEKQRLTGHVSTGTQIGFGIWWATRYWKADGTVIDPATNKARPAGALARFLKDLSYIGDAAKAIGGSLFDLLSKARAKVGKNITEAVDNSSLPEQVKQTANFNVGPTLKSWGSKLFRGTKAIAPSLLDLMFIGTAVAQVRSLDGRSLRSEWIEASKNFLNTSINIVVGSVLAKAGLGRVLSTSLLLQESGDVYGRNLGNLLADQADQKEEIGRNLVYGSAALLTVGSFAGVLGRNKLKPLTEKLGKAAPFITAVTIPFDFSTRRELTNQINNTYTGRVRNYELSAQSDSSSLYAMSATTMFSGLGLYHPAVALLMGAAGLARSAGFMQEDEPKRLLTAGIVTRRKLKELAEYKNRGAIGGGIAGAATGFTLGFRSAPQGTGLKGRLAIAIGYATYGYYHGTASGSDLGRNMYIAKESDKENWMNVATSAVIDFTWPLLFTRPFLEKVLRLPGRDRLWRRKLNKYGESKYPATSLDPAPDSFNSPSSGPDTQGPSGTNPVTPPMPPDPSTVLGNTSASSSSPSQQSSLSTSTSASQSSATINRPQRGILNNIASVASVASSSASTFSSMSSPPSLVSSTNGSTFNNQLSSLPNLTTYDPTVLSSGIDKTFDMLTSDYFYSDLNIASGKFGVIKRLYDTLYRPVDKVVKIFSDNPPQRVNPTYQADNTNLRELELQSLASSEGLSPKVYEIIGSQGTVTKSPYDLKLSQGEFVKGFVMDYVQGDVLGTNSSLEHRKLAVKQLATLHSLGIVHRDLHINNVMIERKRSFGLFSKTKAYFVDFGEAVSSNEVSSRVEFEAMKQSDLGSLITHMAVDGVNTSNSTEITDFREELRKVYSEETNRLNKRASRNRGFFRLAADGTGSTSLFDVGVRSLRTSLSNATAGARQVISSGFKGAVKGGIAELGFVPDETGRIRYSNQALKSAQFSPLAITMSIASVGLQAYEDIYVKELPKEKVAVNAGIELTKGVLFSVAAGATLQGISATGLALTAQGIAAGSILTIGASIATPVLLGIGAVLLYNQLEQVENAYIKKNNLSRKAYSTQAREIVTGLGLAGLGLVTAANPMSAISFGFSATRDYFSNQYKKYQQELTNLKAKTKRKSFDVNQFQSEIDQYKSRVENKDFFSWLLTGVMDSFRKIGDESRKAVMKVQGGIRKGIQEGVQGVLDGIHGFLSPVIKSNISAADKAMLIQLSLAEAESEGLAGQAAVIRSVLNRKALIDSGRASASDYISKSGSVFDIISAYNPGNRTYQYSPVGDGRINRKFTKAQYEQAERAYYIALSDKKMSELGISLGVINSPNFQRADLGRGSVWKGAAYVLGEHAFGQDRFSVGQDLRQLFNQQFAIEEPVTLQDSVSNALLGLPQASNDGSGASRRGNALLLKTITSHSGGGAAGPYHIDFAFNPALNLSIKEQVKLFEPVFQTYQSMGRRIEFSNSAVAGLVYQGTQEQKEQLLRRAQAAHTGRRSGRNNYPFDYYVPMKGANRYTGSAPTSVTSGGARVPFVIPILEGGYFTVSQFRPGAGQKITGYNAKGQWVYESYHGEGGPVGTFYFPGHPKANQSNNNNSFVNQLVQGLQNAWDAINGKGNQPGQASVSNLNQVTGNLIAQYGSTLVPVYKPTKGKAALWSIGGKNTGHEQLNANSTYSSLKRHWGGKKDYTTPFGPARDLQLFVNGNKMGTPIRAAQDAVVRYSGPSYNAKGQITGYGNVVELYSIDGKPLARNAHLLSVAVKSGQVVKAGDIIGYQGGTGAGGNKNAYPPHLHIEAGAAYINAFIKGTLTGMWMTTAMTVVPPSARPTAQAQTQTSSDQLLQMTNNLISANDTRKMSDYYNTKTTAAFRNKAKAVAGRLGMSSDWLIAIIGFETDATFSPSKKNLMNSDATGLIQFMSRTARGMFGLSLKQMAAMSAEKQLEYVERYFRNTLRGRKPGSLTDAYMAVLWPAAIGKGKNYALFRKGTDEYKQNILLDANNDGVVTAGEATAKVEAYLPNQPLLNKYKEGYVPPKPQSTKDIVSNTGRKRYNEPPASQLVKFSDSNNQRVERNAARDLSRMLSDLKKETGVDLWVVSGFRSVADQQSIWDRKRKKGQTDAQILKANARPGESEHHTGKAVDLSLQGTSNLNPSEWSSNPLLRKAFSWLQSNAGEYNFSLSYPKGNNTHVQFEPWHWFHNQNQPEQPVKSSTRRQQLVDPGVQRRVRNVLGLPDNQPKVSPLVKQLNAISISSLEPLKRLMYAGEGNPQSINVIRRDKKGNRITGYASNFLTEFGKSAEQVTLGEIRARQKQTGTIKGKTEIGAVGYPQFIGNTLGKAMASLGLSDSTKFDHKTQDLLFKWLIFVKRPEVGAYLTGRSNNLKEANQGLAREFASIGLAYPEAPYDELVKSNSKSIPADAKQKRGVGQSLYSGVAGNKASKSPEYTQSVLKEVRRLLLGGNKPRLQGYNDADHSRRIVAEAPLILSDKQLQMIADAKKQAEAEVAALLKNKQAKGVVNLTVSRPALIDLDHNSSMETATTSKTKVKTYSNPEVVAVKKAPNTVIIEYRQSEADSYMNSFSQYRAETIDDRGSASQPVKSSNA